MDQEEKGPNQTERLVEPEKNAASFYMITKS